MNILFHFSESNLSKPSKRNRCLLKQNELLDFHLGEKVMIQFRFQEKRMAKWGFVIGKLQPWLPYLIKITNNFIKQPQTFQSLFINIGLIIKLFIIGY